MIVFKGESFQEFQEAMGNKPEDFKESKHADIQDESRMTTTPGTSVFNAGIVQTANKDPDRLSLFRGK